MEGGRARRTALLGATFIVLSVAGHSTASSTLPSVFAVAVVSAVSVALAWAVSQRRRSFAGTAAIVVGAEALIHVLLVLAGGHHAGASLLPDARMVVMHLAAAVAAAAVLRHADDCFEIWDRLFRTELGLWRLMPVLPDPAPETPGLFSTTAVWCREPIRDIVAPRGPPARRRSAMFA